MSANPTNQNQRMTGGAAIVAALAHNGIDTVFGIPGVQVYELFDALGLASNRIRTIAPRHEQATAYMAYGYARATGKPGVYAVVPGPGILNAAAAALTAHSATTPLLALTGQVPTTFLGQGREHLHELPDQVATLRSFLKDAHRIDHPADAPRMVQAALAQALSGRPGVVALEMAWDVMSKSAQVSLGPAQSMAELRAARTADPQDIEAAVAMIRQAKRPMIIAGGGALDAGAELLDLATLLDAPVTSHRSARGIVSEADRLGLPAYAAYKLWADCDLLIGVGSRLELPYMRWLSFLENRPRAATPRLIRIDVDAFEMTRVRPDVAVIGDARLSVHDLVEALRLAGVEKSAWGERLADVKAEARAEMVARLQPQMGFLDVMRDVLPDDAIIVDELSQLGFAAQVGLPIYQARSYISAGAQGTLGYGFATALGAKVGQPDRTVLSITGDGGLLFGIQELATAAEYNIATVTVLVNNGGYANVRRDQITRFQGREFRADFRNPNFAKIADGFGVAHHLAATPAALRPALEAAIASTAPALIEIPMERGAEAPPWPFLMPAGLGNKR